MLKKKLLRLSVFGFPLILIFSQCIKFNKEDPRGNTYAGSATCISCHKGVYNSYLHTAHFMASQPPGDSTIQGSFNHNENEYTFAPYLKVVMDKRDSGYFQTSYLNGRATQSKRFDIVFGGVKGQTYGYWLSNELFQLPISYVKPNNEWVNSPGYPSNSVDFERVIGTRCLGCHMSFIKQAPPGAPNFYGTAEGFEKSSVVYGVDCERCHGPAAEHVKFQTAHPDVKEAKFITTYSSLTREQKINMCAVCHSGGNNHLVKPTFGFKPGDSLKDYMKIIQSNSPVNYKVIDVHGNQRALLESSKCFINSNMDCSTCHNTHVNERENIKIFAAKCLTCHGSSHNTDCKLKNQLPDSILTARCVDCHMPAFSSKAIIIARSQAFVRTHHIAIYPESTQKVLGMLNIQLKNINTMKTLNSSNR